MKRRRFLVDLGRALALGAAPLAALGGCAGRRPRPRALRHWAWVHGYRERTEDGWHGHFSRLKDAGLHGVLAQRGDAAELARAAHEQGLAFHRWTWILNRSRDERVKREHPEWFTVSREGKSSLEHPPYVPYYQWLCPTRPEVREYLRRDVDRIASIDGVDGVHLDYIRHCDVILPVGLWAKYDLVQNEELPPFDFCYCGACRDAFGRQYGRDPMRMASPQSDPEWREFRWNGVNEVVRELARACRARGKQATAAVFPTPRLARRLVRQSWDVWPLDAVFPMLYNGFYEEGLPWIGDSVREGAAAIPGDRPLYAGLYLPDLSPDDLARAVRLACDAGASGVSLFESDVLTDEHLARFREAIAYFA